MKSFKFLLPFSLVLLLAGGCEGFLDRDPLGQETDQNFFNNEQNAILAVNAIYNAASRSEGPSPYGWLPHNYEFIYGDILSDDAVKGSTASDFISIKQMEEWTVGPDYGPAAGSWVNLYVGVFRANTVIKNLPEATIDEDLKTRLLGEAHFMRGYFYFYLGRVFGGVPLFAEPVKPSESGTTSRASLEATYKFAEDDFRLAAQLLPERSAYAVEDRGRATKGAANGYLARCLMYQVGMGINSHTWQEVFDATKVVMNSGEYALDANYARLFEVEGENGIESLFEIQAKNSSIADGDNKTGVNDNIFQNNRSTWGWGFNNPTQNFVDEFETGDPRLPCTVIKDGDVVLGEKQTVEYPSANETGYLNRKAATLTPNPGKSGDQNIRKLRYADVLLMHAEAAYHVGQEAVARDILNQIRNRARQATKPKGSVEGELTYVPYPAGELDNVLPPIAASVSGQALLDAIYHERRVELGMESLRFWDLVRTGRYMASLETDAIRAAAMSRSVTTGTAVPVPVMPVPLDEVQSWGLQQNPGY